MKIRILFFGFACALSLYGQRKFNWQNYCFQNPTAPFCMGHEDAIRHVPQGKTAEPQTGVKSPLSSTAGAPEPDPMIVGGIDWRFADPSADALAALDGGKLPASPLARSLIVQLGINRGLPEAEARKMFEALCGAGHVALSVRGEQSVLMFTGRAPDSVLPAPEAGWEAVPVIGSAMLIGPAEAVDRAVQRILTQDQPGELALMAAQRQTDSEFWAAGSAKLAGPEAAVAGVRRYWLVASMGDRLASDTAFEFDAAPDANALRTWLKAPGEATIEGNVVHVKMSADAEEARQASGQIAASPLGQRLSALVQAARGLPMRGATVHTKPVIYGLDGGAREVH
ncbi:MAG TPA: hypothetical protein VGR73_06120 [Bryobacteraceae bacterium]|nr:hypothetical protein [Bryobacteraceae bacterium]